MLIVARPFATATRRFTPDQEVHPREIPEAEQAQLIRAGYLAPAPAPETVAPAPDAD